MKELMDQLQTLIEKNIDKPVSKQMSLLEPLFDQIYQNKNLELKDMLRLSQLENQLTKRIIEVCPKVEPSTSEKEKIIEQLIYYSRKRMEELYHCSIVNDSLKARSFEFCNIVLEIAKNLEVTACMFNLSDFLSLPYKHYMVIAYFNYYYYVIDLTYQQFFLLGNNFKNRYYEHPSYTRTCDIGRRIIERDFNTAKKMIVDGYLKDLEQIKSYFDEFSDEKLSNGRAYLKLLISPLKGSNDKREKVLYAKLERN